jgi:SAM-dependent methyltransferase
MLRFFARSGRRVVGTDVTPEMLEACRRLGLPEGCTLLPTDGVSIPLADRSVDLAWASGVLKYTLFPPTAKCRGGGEPDAVVRGGGGQAGAPGAEPFAPVYDQVAREMYRVVKPGGHVVNFEMYVDALPEVFLPDFRQAGFTLRTVRVLRRYQGLPERICQWRRQHRLPPGWVLGVGRLLAAARSALDNPNRRGRGLRDYLFVWSKPPA